MTSLHQNRIAFIGSGAMGEAMIKGLLSRQLIAADHIIGSDPVAARRTLLTNTYGVQTTDDNVRAVQEADIVVMSIKPQMLGAVGATLQGTLSPNALVLSIMAGVSLKTLQSALSHERIVRSMPNTPAQVNMGVTAWIATTAVDAAQREQTALLLGALGEQIQETFPKARIVKALNTMWCGIMVNPGMINGGDHDTFICGNDAEAKEVVRRILSSFGWAEKNIHDLGDITKSRGTEMYLPLWLSIYGPSNFAAFNIKIVS